MGELPLSGGRGRQGRHGAGRERGGRRGGRRRHGALQRIHVVEAPAEGGDLLRALWSRKEATLKGSREAERRNVAKAAESKRFEV